MAKRKGDATKIAEINFQPISRKTLKRLQSVTDEDWLNHLVTIRLAFVALSKTKEELKEVARKALADDQFNSIEGFQSSIEFLSVGVEFLTAAKARLLCAGLAVIEEGEART